MEAKNVTLLAIYTMKQQQATVALNISQFPIHHYYNRLPFFANVKHSNYELPQQSQKQIKNNKPISPQPYLKSTMGHVNGDGQSKFLH